MELPEQGQSCQTERLVARVLLECAEDISTGHHRLTQRDIASTIGVDWDLVYISLKSLQRKGAVRIDRNRMNINKKLLENAAGRGAATPPVSHD